MTALATPAAPVRAVARPSIARLTGVELRKLTDTRASLWLLIATAALTLAIVALVCVAGDPPDHTFLTLLSAAVQPAALLLPVMGILLVTSEWSQRTALITFALVPQRGRVLLAKLLAGSVLATAAFVLCVAVSAVAAAIMAADTPGVWELSPGRQLQSFVFVLTAMATGIGFGAVLLSSAPAIVISFVLPIAFAALGSLSALDGVAEWLDSTRTLGPLTDELFSGAEWARALTTLALWMLLPLVAGWWRIRREEVR